MMNYVREKPVQDMEPEPSEDMPPSYNCTTKSY